MADNTPKTIMSICATVSDRIKNLVIKEGQLIFLHDVGTIALDYKGKRTFYNQIIELEAEVERKNLSEPINGKYYFIVGYIYNGIFNNIVGAIFYLSQALKFAEESKSIQLEVKVRIALGEAYRIKGNEEDKMKVLKPLIEEDKYNSIDSFYKNLIRENIIESYLVIGDFERAHDLIEEMECLVNTTYSLENEHSKLLLLDCKIKYLMSKIGFSTLSYRFPMYYPSEQLIKKIDESYLGDET